MTVLWFNLGICLIPPPGWRGSLTDWVMLLALPWHTGYQSLCLPRALPENRAGGAGRMESVLGLAGLYPAAPEPRCRLSSALTLWGTRLLWGWILGNQETYVKSMLRVTCRSQQAGPSCFWGRKFALTHPCEPHSPLLMLARNPLSFILLIWESPHKMRDAELFAMDGKRWVLSWGHLWLRYRISRRKC